MTWTGLGGECAQEHTHMITQKGLEGIDTDIAHTNVFHRSAALVEIHLHKTYTLPQPHTQMYSYHLFPSL